MSVLGDQSSSPATGEAVRVLESCAFTWVFDETRRRFRRVPRGAALDVPYPADAWVPYDRLELNSSRSSFSVVTSTGGNLVFRCWLHRDPCPRCGPAPEAGADLGELRWLISRWKSRIGIPEEGEREGPAPFALGSPLAPARRWGVRGSSEP